jgi:hypothetical protein
MGSIDAPEAEDYLKGADSAMEAAHSGTQCVPP